MKFATRSSRSKGAASEEPPAKKQKVEQPAKEKPEPAKKETKNAPKKGKADKKAETIENDVDSKVDSPTKNEKEAASKEEKSKNAKSDGTTLKVPKAKAATKSTPKPDTKKAAKSAETAKGKKTPPAKKSTPKRGAAKKAPEKSATPTPEKKAPASEKKASASKEKAPAAEKKTPAPQKKAPPAKPAANKTTAPRESARKAAQKRKSEAASKKAPVKKAKKGEIEEQPTQATVVEETPGASATGESHLESSPVIKTTQRVVIESNVALQAGSTVDANIGNIVPSVAPVDLLPIQNVLESSPQRLSKLIMQPSQELPAEIFQNEQIVTVTSPQKSPKILKLIIGPRSPDIGHAQGFSPTSGPAVIVRQNTSADVGNPDQITCLNVLNSSPRRSVGLNENDSSGGDTTPSVSDAKSSPPHSVAGTFIPSSPGRYSMVGEGLHNYCKSPLLAPYDLTPPNKLGKSTSLQHKSSTTQQKSSVVQQKSVPGQQKSTAAQRKTSTTGEQSTSTDKKTTAKASGSTKTKAPKRQQSTSAQPAPATAGPSGTRRSSRGTAGVPPKRDSMVEIPIVNRRRSSSATAS